MAPADLRSTARRTQRGVCRIRSDAAKVRLRPADTYHVGKEGWSIMFMRYVILLTVVVALAMALPMAASAATTTVIGTVARVTRAGVDTDVMTVQSNVPWELRVWSKGGSDLVTGTPTAGTEVALPDDVTEFALVGME